MAEQNGIPQVEVTELAEDTVFLDVREPNEYAAGHAPGAVSVPLGQVRDRLAEIPAVDGPLAVICRSGARSQKVAEFLASQGVPAINVTGGTTAWAAAGKKLASETGEDPAVVAPSTQPPPEV